MSDQFNTHQNIATTYNETASEENKFPEVGPPILDLNYNVSNHEVLGKANEMKHSESLFGKKPTKPISPTAKK